MNREEFYKELYFKEFERKREINNSLQIPIGILTGLVAALYFLITKFDFELNILNSGLFIIILLLTLVFLGITIFHLIRALANFHDGYPYAYLADANDLENFYKGLKDYYATSNSTEDETKKEFDEYVLQEIINNTDINQKNNKSKSYHRYKCQTHLVNTFLLICVILLPFGYNYVYKIEKKATISVELNSPKEFKINSSEIISKIDSLIIKHIKMADEKKPQKPTPPPSQLIKEGQNPKPPTTPTPPRPKSN